MNHVIKIDAKSLFQNNNNLLTKSFFLRACECPRKLAYYFSNTYKYKTKESSPFLQNLSNDGKTVERYARTVLFDNKGVVVKDDSSFSSIDNLVTQTRHLLESQDEITLLEGAFLYNSCFMRADILHKPAPRKLHLLEVKSKAWHANTSTMMGKRGGIKSDFLPYIRDVAFQKYILQQCYPDHEISASLVMPDTTKVNTTVPNLNQMFSSEEEKDLLRKALLFASADDEILVTAVNVDELVEEVLTSPLSGVPGGDEEMTFQQAVTSWVDMISHDSIKTTVQPPPIGSQCRDCEFRTNEKQSGFAECWEITIDSNDDQNDDLIIDIHHVGKQTVDKLIRSGRYHMCDVTTDDLKLNRDGVDTKKKDHTGISRRERQWLQIKNEPSVVLDRQYLESEMEIWHYPWHFVDFETIAPALPFTIQKRPFQMLAFQFSHHVLHEDGQVEHVSEFLHAIPGACPNRAFLESLAESLMSSANGGTVFRWGSHENTVLAALLDEQDNGDAELSASSRSFLEALLTTGDNPMVDLMRVCEKGYYAPGSGASSSIKKLLLPTMRASRMLQYKYSRPYTGKNFTGMMWWQQDKHGELCDPYVLLGALKDEQSSLIAQGGDAIVAYNLLQDSTLDVETRMSIEKSLLRYCELDTLAMVMIAQGLVDLMEQDDRWAEPNLVDVPIDQHSHQENDWRR